VHFSVSLREHLAQRPVPVSLTTFSSAAYKENESAMLATIISSFFIITFGLGVNDRLSVC